jgi:hypothetical protein
MDEAGQDLPYLTHFIRGVFAPPSLKGWATRQEDVASWRMIDSQFPSDATIRSCVTPILKAAYLPPRGQD